MPHLVYNRTGLLKESSHYSDKTVISDAKMKFWCVADALPLDSANGPTDMETSDKCPMVVAV